MLVQWPSLTSGGESYSVMCFRQKTIPLFCIMSNCRSLFKSNKTLQGDARLYRNIAVIGDRLKYVELQVHYKASVVFKDQFLSNGWMAATWSRPANCLSSDGWHEDNRIMDSNDLKVDNELYFKLLPKPKETVEMPMDGLSVWT
ncbi:unnamed protein product [Urochloa humidicola]